MKKIGIIGAMEEEVAKLKENMQIQETSVIAGMEFCQGICEGQNVVIVRSGIGKVNAAVCTQILCDVFKVNAIINTGVAGSLKNEINIGDIVLSEDALQHDMDATGFGYDPGVIPRMEESVFKGDETLLKLAQKVCQEVNPDIQVFRGRVVSGDQFISDHDVKQRIVNSFGGFCTEMEGAAIAQTAWLNKVPYLVIRAISDKADGSAEMDYSEFEMKAIEHTVRLMTGMLRNM
ncbi:MAG: 5'-methylthioadenosine/adenosylhomocysteine nucleosidase [Frisingicoccus sp.]|uniref:5'-methylthioadenosine/adenosylhomocysteine nucleosidase n=1 Tax=Frisingicoccus sp. TaxID=1918627 RepID=UPI00262366C0|nr:5'-methylthioadenosine/adenosylhomocysteine nucleosidase [Frisingicoccus sp.]MDD6231437.1 5'-methylthioadenosine/adenosylhomocysteine nucleosidase [Frisingicoccus sp.]MDY4834513.1 5'-methylthioadenosine/adenosylhomocysteine nucleosidase [Frisingicoccus sp.]